MIEPGGVQVERDVIVHPGSVVILPVFKDGRILLIRQYRHSVGEFLWDLVAGRKEPNESPLAVARRELIEETGYRAKRLRKLMRVVPTPGFVNEWMWIFAAEEIDRRRGATGRRRKDHAANFYFEASGEDDRARDVA